MCFKSVNRLSLTVGFFSIWVGGGSVFAQEIVIKSVHLPGASMEQEVTYYPSEQEYELFRDSVLKSLRAGDPEAFVNPIDAPWMRAETSAKIGIAYQGVGVAKGRKNIRQITASEEALLLFEKER